MLCLWFKKLRRFFGTSQESKSKVNKRLLFLSPWVKVYTLVFRNYSIEPSRENTLTNENIIYILSCCNKGLQFPLSLQFIHEQQYN